MKKISLFLSLSILLLAIGCTKEDNHLSVNEVEDAVTVQNHAQEDGISISARAGDCSCTITSISQSIASVELCGPSNGSGTCTHCASIAADAFLDLSNMTPDGDFCMDHKSALRVTNVSGSTVGFTVDCGGTTQTVILANNDSHDFVTDDNCNLDDC